MSVAFSVDLEPNKDGSFDGVAESMDWYDSIVPQGTIYVTKHIAEKRPGIVADLTDAHEIGVHVHPREFGYESDDLASLDPPLQRRLIERTRHAVSDAAGLDPGMLTAFRAGRHKASPETLSVLSDLDFEIDASVNVRYRNYMPPYVTDSQGPFRHESGLLELPVSYGNPPIFSRLRLRTGISGTLTATAHELRSDRGFCTGLDALVWLFEETESIVSMYMHPYDATSYHDDLENCGELFRDRLRTLFEHTSPSFVTASEVCKSVSEASIQSGKC